MIIDPTDITEWVLSVTPGQIIDFAPTQTPSSITIGLTIKSNVEKQLRRLQ